MSAWNYKHILIQKNFHSDCKWIENEIKYEYIHLQKNFKRSLYIDRECTVRHISTPTADQKQLAQTQRKKNQSSTYHFSQNQPLFHDQHRSKQRDRKVPLTEISDRWRQRSQSTEGIYAAIQ